MKNEKIEFEPEFRAWMCAWNMRMKVGIYGMGDLVNFDLKLDIFDIQVKGIKDFKHIMKQTN